MRNLLVVGCGDIGLRAAALLMPHYRLFALSHSPERFCALRKNGIVPIFGDLDEPSSLSRIAGIAHAVLHFAPPGNQGSRDVRTRNLLAALTKCAIVPHRMVYISTSGVYGDCDGELVAETRPTHPQTLRAVRRLDAEMNVRQWGRRNGISVCILRVPGIYSKERISLSRLSMPVLQESDDVYTNHIHAEDLARVAVRALQCGANGRIYNVSDDSSLKMGDYFDFLAGRFGRPLPLRLPRDELRNVVPESMYSFMSESRRLDNSRMKKELGIVLGCPRISDGLDC
ncbi:MAG: SDR family oxidoreductase [Burkholderiales bacterium]